MSELIDGKTEASRLRALMREKIDELQIKPGLAVILVGDNKASTLYVRNKNKMASEAGMFSKVITFPKDVDNLSILLAIEELNNNSSIHGILVQLPLPSHIKKYEVISAIDPKKDVDCFHPYNVGRLFLNLPTLMPCTPLACVHLIKRFYSRNLSGKNAVVIGRSDIVGKPVAFLLLAENCTVKIVHSRTIDMHNHLLEADIIVSATGIPGLVQKVKDGAVVIDVGINHVDGKLVGDVEFDKVIGSSSFITPVPGGVGPMTIAYLLVNTFLACARQKSLDFGYQDFI